MNGEFVFETSSAGVGIALRCAASGRASCARQLISLRPPLPCCHPLLLLRVPLPPALCIHSPFLFPPPPGRSVIFFTSLLLVGFGLPKFVKQPLKKGWTWVKDHTLCCFRRRPSGPTKLPAPTAPAAEAVGEAVDAAPTPAAAPAS